MDTDPEVRPTPKDEDGVGERVIDGVCEGVREAVTDGVTDDDSEGVGDRVPEGVFDGVVEGVGDGVCEHDWKYAEPFVAQQEQSSGATEARGQ